VAAVAPVSADSPWVNFAANCRPSARALPLLAFHGTRDAAVSYEGGYETVGWWRGHNGCSEQKIISFTGGVTTCESWLGCRAQPDGTATNVTFCSAEGVGHIYW
jgi:poly(3-hydroxybutyrate) depolymerase